MSDQTATGVDTARAYLAQDLEALHKQRRLSAILGIILVILVVCYMTWLWSAVRYITKPDNLASAMSGYVEVSLPDWKRSANAVVKDDAPKVAKYIGDSVVRELPTVLRDAVEKMVMEYAAEISDTAAKHLQAAFEGVVAGATAELRQAAASGIEEEQAAILARALDHQLERAAKEAAESPFEENLLTKLEKSQKALANLNDKLEKLLDPKSQPETRRGKLERRFVLTFWKFMQQENPDLRVRDEGKKGN